MYRKVVFESGQYGFFHGWGLDAVEDYGTIVSYTVAIIEMEDGTVRRCSPSEIKFTDKPTEKDN